MCRRGFAAGVGPVLQENVLEPAHGGAAQLQVRVAPGPLAADVFVFFVGDIDAANEAHAPVAHHELAVGAQIDQRPEAVQPRGVKQRQFAACGQQLLQRLAAAAAGVERKRAYGIDQQAHGHAFARLGRQGAQHGLAGFVGPEDVVLQMNVRARLPNGLQQRLQRLAAAAQQARAVAGGHGQAAAALDQPRVLQGPGGRLGLLAAQRLPVVLRKQAGAVMPALEPLALHALRAKVGIHGQAHNGREAEHQNPRQRGHGRALLQHDPRGQRQRVGGPDAAQPR